MGVARRLRDSGTLITCSASERHILEAVLMVRKARQPRVLLAEPFDVLLERVPVVGRRRLGVVQHRALAEDMLGAQLREAARLDLPSGW